MDSIWKRKNNYTEKVNFIDVLLPKITMYDKMELF